MLIITFTLEQVHFMYLVLLPWPLSVCRCDETNRWAASLRGPSGALSKRCMGHCVWRCLGPSWCPGGMQAAGLWWRHSCAGGVLLRTRRWNHSSGQCEVHGHGAVTPAVLPHTMGRAQLWPLGGCRCDLLTHMTPPIPQKPLPCHL